MRLFPSGKEDFPMERMGAFFVAGLCALALVKPSMAEELQPGRDQAVLNAILRVEARYLEQDQRDPRVGHHRLLVAQAQAEDGNEKGAADNREAAKGQTERKAKYLDKLLNLNVLTKETVLAAYRKAEEAVGARAAANKPSPSADRLEAYKDLLRELKIAHP
jgi:hypothetical protein